MAYVISGARFLVGKPVVGDGNCAVMVQREAKLPNHRFWRQGVHVVEQQNVWPGTAIATFENGVYPNWKTGNHVAFFLRFGRRNPDGTAASIWVVEQYHGLTRIQQREIAAKGQVDSQWGKRWRDPSNNADAFYVIER